jgi:hypothetical protein
MRQRAAAVWNVAEGARFGFRRVDGQWVVHPLIHDAWAGAVAVGRRGTALVAWRAPRNAVSDGGGSLFERHRVDGVWSRPTRLGSGGGEVAAVIDRWGASTVASGSGRGLAVVSRTARGSWGEVTRFGGSYVDAFDLEANHRGDLVLAWEVGPVVRTAFRTRGGDWTLGPTLRNGVAYPVELEASLDRSGRALVMWGVDPDMEGLEKKYLSWATAAPDGAFTSTTFLDERTKPEVWGVQDIGLSVNRKGEGLAVWSTDEETGYTSHVARFDGTGWTEVADLGAPGASGALLTGSGTAVAALGTRAGSRQFWWYQHPGEQWQRRKVEVGRPSSTSLDGAGRAMALLGVSDRVTARFLRVPPAGPPA